MSKSAEQFWAKFLDANPHIDPTTPYQVWYFSNTSQSARELAGLVLAGKKTATASLQAVNEAEPEKAPIENGYSVVTDFEGEPLCVIQTTEIRHTPFNDVDAQFAFDEGEGDRTLEDWRKTHWAYFAREAPQFGVNFGSTSMICCERFRLLYPKTGNR
jgi:uncharacterized protein YhfF